MLISSLTDIEKFLELFPELEEDEVLFISLSSRSKYLTPKQKEDEYVINRNEMFHRRWFHGSKVELMEQIVKYLKGVNLASKFVNDLDCEDYLTDFYTKGGRNIPLNTVVVYVNVHPSSMIKAAANLGSEILKKMVESNPEWFLHINSRLNTEVQKARSRREFVDIDFDVDSFKPVEQVRNLVGGHPIKTHSGYHLLVPKKNLAKGMNLESVLESARQKFENKEIVINKNAMIPLPGTFSGGTGVSFV